MEQKRSGKVFIPLALSCIAAFYLMVWENLPFGLSCALIAIGLSLYFAFLQRLRPQKKLWFFIMLTVFLISSLFWLSLSLPLTVKIIPTVILVIELVSLKMLYSEATIEAGLLKPSLEKIALLVCFLTFAPTPMFLMFQTGYLPIVHFILSMLMDMKNIKPVDLLSAAPALGVFLLFSSLFGFAYYVIICLMQRRAVLRVSLLLTTAFMIITAATQKVYETSGEGTDTPESTAIELYSSLFPEAKEPDRTKEPLPFVLPPVRGKEDMGPPEIQPVPVAPSTIKRMPENSYQQKGKSIRPGYDIERQFYTEEQKEPSGH